jgi:hypothetical protein
MLSNPVALERKRLLSSDHPSHYKVKPKDVMLQLFERLLGLTSGYDDRISAHMLP